MSHTLQQPFHDNHSPELRRVLAIAAIEAEREQAGQVGVAHVLVAMCQEGVNIGAALFSKQGITLDDLRQLNFEPKQPTPLT